MSLLLAALLANQALPFIDRPALRVLAKQEATQARRPRVVKTSSPGTGRTIADACATRSQDISSRVARGRAYSLIGSRVSIVETACGLRRSSLGRAPSTQLAAR